MEPVKPAQPLGAAGDLCVCLGLAHRGDVEVALGVVAEVVAAVEDAAGHLGVFVEPAADSEDGDPGVGPFGLGEYGPGDGGVALAVEGEGDAGAVAGAVVDLGRLPGKAARGRRGVRGRVPGGRGRGGVLRARRGRAGPGRRTGGVAAVRASGGQGAGEGGPCSRAQGAAAVHRWVGGVHTQNNRGEVFRKSHLRLTGGAAESLDESRKYSWISRQVTHHTCDSPGK